MSKRPTRAKLGLARPSETASSSRAGEGTSAAARRVDEGEARLVVNIPERLHRALKMRAVERGITIRALVLELLEHAGIG